MSTVIPMGAIVSRVIMKPNWFARQRIAWIAEMLDVYGFINREHLMRKFGISKPQASNDLQTYQRLNPGGMSYHMSRKYYYRKCDGNHAGPRCADPECWNQ